MKGKSMRHHGNSGLQEHSIGDYYPGGIFTRSGLEPGGEIVAWNLVTGEVYGRVRYESLNTDFVSRYDEALSLIPEDVPFRRHQRQDVPDAVTNKDVAAKRDVPMSKFTVPADERSLSDAFINKFNVRRILCELITFQEATVARLLSEFSERREEFEGAPQGVQDDAQGVIDINVWLKEALIEIVEEGDRRAESIGRLYNDNGSRVGGNPVLDLLRSLGVTDDELAQAQTDFETNGVAAVQL